MKSSTIPYAKLNKRHNILSYHYVRSMVAKGFINLLHIRSAYNLADTLSKHWSHQSNYENLIKPLLNFYDYKNDKPKEEKTILELDLDQLLDEHDIELLLE